MDGELDYSKYSNRELQEARTSIDRSRFPINAARLDSELRARQLSGGIDVVRPPTQPAPVAPPPRVAGGDSVAKLVSFDSLARRDKLAVFWGYIWRSLVVWVASFASAFVVAVLAHLLIGIFFPSSGPMSPDYARTGQIIGFVIGFLVGLYFAWHFLRWILMAKFGRFRLLLGELSSDDAA